jgi:hypothetical protein
VMGCVRDSGEDVFTLEIGIIGQNLSMARAIGQKFRDISDPKTETADARPSPALARFDGDPFQSIGPHDVVARLLYDGMFWRAFHKPGDIMDWGVPLR